MGVLSAVTRTGRHGPIYLVPKLGGLSWGVGVVIAAVAIGRTWLLVKPSPGSVFMVLFAFAVAMLVTVLTGFCLATSFVGWRLRLAAADYAGGVIAWLFAGGRLVLLSFGATVAAILFCRFIGGKACSAGVSRPCSWPRFAPRCAL